MLIGWRVKNVLCPRRKVVYREKVKLPYVATGSCLTSSSFGNKKLRVKRMTVLNTMSWVRHLSVRWSGTLSQCVFFLGHFFSAHPRRFGEKKSDEKHRKKSTWPKIPVFRHKISLSLSLYFSPDSVRTLKWLGRSFSRGNQQCQQISNGIHHHLAMSDTRTWWTHKPTHTHAATICTNLAVHITQKLYQIL